MSKGIDFIRSKDYNLTMRIDTKSNPSWGQQEPVLKITWCVSVGIEHRDDLRRNPKQALKS